MISNAPVSFPQERQIKVKLLASERFEAMRNVALMNATNTNKIP